MIENLRYHFRVQYASYTLTCLNYVKFTSLHEKRFGTFVSNTFLSKILQHFNNRYTNFSKIFPFFTVYSGPWSPGLVTYGRPGQIADKKFLTTFFFASRTHSDSFNPSYHRVQGRIWSFFKANRDTYERYSDKILNF